jgi:two-component sensor histidine kinase
LRSTARALADADGICVVLRDESHCHYVAEDAIAPLWAGGRFPMNTCISGWVMMNREPAVISDVSLDKRIPHAIYRQTFVKALAMIPIGGDEPVAALGAYWARNYTPPPEVIETLDTLARAAATAFENVHLVEALTASPSKVELAREDLRHRLANALGAVKAIAESELSVGEAEALSSRIDAMLRAQGWLNAAMGAGTRVSLADLVAAELAPYRKEGDNRVEVSGPDVTVSGAQALALALVLNDLAAKSARQGALIGSKGRVKLAWREADRVVSLEWQETGAFVHAAGDDNNVTLLLRRVVGDQLGGHIRGVASDGRFACFIEFTNETTPGFPANA